VPRGVWFAAAVAAAVALGILASVRPVIAIGVAAGAVFVPLVVTRPILGLCTLLFLSFLEEYSGVTGAFSLTKIVGLLLVLAWVGVVATDRRDDRSRTALLALHPLLAAALGLFLAWAFISAAWAESPGEARSADLRFALNFVLFPIALIAIRTPRHVLWLFAVFVASGLTAVAFGLPGATEDPADVGRLSGAGLNPNQLGQLLAVAVVLAVALAASRRCSSVVRLAAVAAAALAAIGLFLTLSRGALLGLAAAALIAPLAVGHGRRLIALVLVVATLVGAVAWYAAIAPETALDRITHPERHGGSGREDLWRVGRRMVEDRPVQGVGAGNFPVSSINYLLRPGRTEQDRLIVDTPKVAHNIYLTVLAELGIVGLALFLVILGCCLRSALRAARLFAARGDPTMELLARGLFIGLFGLLVADFFSSQLFSKQLWLLLATAPAMLALAQRGARTPDGALRPSDGALRPFNRPQRVRAPTGG
jgi:putative inorganic carbon (hco3(-)) transporter